MGLRAVARHVIEQILFSYGYELKVAQDPLRGPAEFFKFLSKRGFRCGTLIDIGAGLGTPWLYDGFPDAYLVLVEPNGDFEPALQKTCAARRGEYHLFAAGAEATKKVIYINQNFPTSSGFLKVSTPLSDYLKSRSVYRNDESRVVSVKRLDALDLRNFVAPYIVKIDTEGYVLPVIEGAAGLLPNTEFIIAEVSVANRFEDESSLWCVLKFLEENNFRLFDLIDMTQTSSGGQLSYIDLVFIHERSKFAEPNKLAERRLSG